MYVWFSELDLVYGSGSATVNQKPVKTIGFFTDQFPEQVLEIQVLTVPLELRTGTLCGRVGPML